MRMNRKSSRSRSGSSSSVSWNLFFSLSLSLSRFFLDLYFIYICTTTSSLLQPACGSYKLHCIYNTLCVCTWTGGRERVTIAARETVRHSPEMNGSSFRPRAKTYWKAKKAKEHHHHHHQANQEHYGISFQNKKQQRISLSRRGLMAAITYLLSLSPSKHFYAGCTFLFWARPIAANRFGTFQTNIVNVQIPFDLIRITPEIIGFAPFPPKQRSIKNRLFFVVT